ncbi:hypothetical protein [Ekhidna lutea]|nr:hypothetical protein [Ekhidna lutea]
MNKHKNAIRSGITLLAVYLITSFHHVYGAVLYDTPWRTHIAYQGASWLVVSYVLLLICIRWDRLWLRWIYAIISGFFFVLAIGLYEGFYNHILKNILYFIGLAEETLLSMYPPPKYELPNDWLFELSGILTFGVSVWCFLTLVNYVRNGSLVQKTIG